MPVNTPRAEYQAAMPAWTRACDVFCGSDAIKARGTAYLPMIGGAKDSAAKYEAYKLRALFYNAFRRTVQGLAGMIFGKPPMVKVPDRGKPILKDATLASVPFNSFALDVTEEVLKVGRVGILVDMATKEAPDQRPYLVKYTAKNIVSWRTERQGGDETLVMVILREEVESPDPKDRFLLKCDEQYRVCELIEGRYVQTIWREQSKGDWRQVEELAPARRGEPLTFIPFVFLSPTSVSPDVQAPPLDDLAHVVISHYQGSADLKHALHWVALPTPIVMGAPASDGPLEIGSSVAWVLEKDGDAKMLEYTGAGVASIRMDLEDMRKLMASLGARLLEDSPAQAETATAVGMRHSGEQASLRTIAESVGRGLSIVLEWCLWWMGTESKPTETKASCELNTDFFAVKASPEDVRAALMAYQADAMSFATFYERLQKGGWAREGVTAEEERQAIESEAPPAPEPPEPDPNAPPMPPGARPPMPMPGAGGA